MKKRVLSALLALCLTLSLAGAAFAENEPSGDSSSAVSQAVSSVESEPQTQNETVSSGSASGEDQTTAKTESTPAPTQTPAASDVTEEEEPESTVAPEATEEPEATAEPDATPAPTEDPEAEVTEKKETDGSVEYTAALETDGQTLNVIVTALEGAFAEDVQPKLSVTMLTAEDELNAVAGELDTAEVQYDGFAALDITFIDEATGEEVEPVKSVTVRIELPQTIVDSGVDLTTLAVQHLEEDENGNVQKVTEVATLDNGITLSEEAAAAANEAAGVAPMSDMPAEEATAGDAAETPAAVAEFEVDGFSSFVITWTDSIIYDAQINVVIRDIDTHQEIDIPGFDSSYWNNKLRNEETITVQDIISHLDTGEYEYANRATYTVQNGQEQEFYSVRARRTSEGSSRKHYYFYFNGSNNYVLVYDSNATIYLYYTKSDSGEVPGGDQGGTTVTNATVTTTKTADLKDDGSGNYDLTLSISGTRGSATEKAAVDVLFIVDRSASMTNNGSQRLANAKTAMKTLVNSLEGNKNIDAQYSIVTFSGSTESQEGGSPNDASVRMDWTKVSGNNVSNSIDGINPSGGTNYEAGLDKGITQLRTARSNAVKVVIFLSDGKPTWSNGYGNGGAALCRELHSDRRFHTCTYQGWVDTLNKASQISCGYFYAISLGGEASDYMKDLVSKVNASTKQAIEAESDGSNLTDLFKDITADVTFFAATDVTITDPLSEYADLVLDADNNPQFTITVQRAASEGVTDETWSTEQPVGNNGTLSFQSLDNKSITVTAQYDTDKKAIVLNFPDDYELEPGYTYSISTVITPSETAKELGMNSAAAQQTPDDNTGTHSIPDEDNKHSKDKGFWSNDNENAKVTFTANGESGSQAFPKPVIQVTQLDTGNLTISKQVGGDATATDVANQTFSFTITAGSDVNTSQLKEGEFTVTGGVQQTVSFKEDQNGAYSALLQISGTGNATIVDLPVGTYTVTETQPTNLQNFTFDTTTDLTDSGTVSKDVNSTVTITNKYHRLKYELTVSKIVGGGMGDTETEFDFTVTLTDTLRNNGAYSFPTGQIPKDLNAIPEQDGVYSFQLSNGDRVVIPLPAGVTAVVAEDTTEHPDYTVTSRKYVTPEIGDEITETTYPFNGGDKQTVENINGNYTVDFKNVRPTVAPTGLEDNHTKPFGLMVGVAVMAGLALAGGAVVRRRRRWME